MVSELSSSQQPSTHSLSRNRGRIQNTTTTVAQEKVSPESPSASSTSSGDSLLNQVTPSDSGDSGSTDYGDAAGSAGSAGSAGWSDMSDEKADGNTQNESESSADPLPQVNDPYFPYMWYIVCSLFPFLSLFSFFRIIFLHSSFLSLC